MTPDQRLAFCAGMMAAEDTAKLAVTMSAQFDTRTELSEEMRLAMKMAFEAACRAIADAIENARKTVEAKNTN